MLAIVLLAFVPFALVVAVVVQRHTDSARAGIMADHLAHARAAANVANSYIDGNLSTLTALAQTRSLRTGTTENADAILGAVLKADPDWLALGLSAPDGSNISGLTSPAHSVNVADRDYFQGAAAGDPTVGSVIITRGALALKTIVLAVPITFDYGTRGVLSGALRLDRVAQRLGESLPATYALRVVDRRGQEFIGHKTTAEAIPIVTADPDIRAAMAGGSGATVMAVDNVDTVVAYAAASRAGWTIVLDEPAALAFAVPDRDVLGALALTIVGLAVALVIAWYFGRRLAHSYADVESARARADTERGRLREALRTAPAQVGLLLGPDLIFAAVSVEQLAPFGFSESRILGRRYRDVDPDPEHVAVIDRVYRTGEPHRSTEARVVTRLPDGTSREAYYNTAIVPLRDVAGHIDGVVYHAVDVTDLVRARQRVEELAAVIGKERDELQQIIDTIPEGIVLMRADRSTIRNHAADEILGRRAVEVAIGEQTAAPRRLNGIPYAIEDTPVVRALRTGEVVIGEQMLVRNATTGMDTPVLISAAPVRRDGEIAAAVAVFQDISSLKALEAQRTEFFSVASHEIKTPITAIQLQLELAQRLQQSGKTERMAEMVRRALERTRDLAALVNDLLAASRIDAGRFGLEPAEIDLAELVRDVVEAFPADETHPLQVSTPAGAVVVNADRRRLVETIENLLSNAVKYSPKGGAIDLDLSVTDGRARLRVRDRGFGIPPEERPYIFQRFFRTSRAKALSGVGLGLYISREIVERHGGALELESTNESGSTFLVELPLDQTLAPTPS